MAVWALGINHTTAPLDLRGRFAFAVDQIEPTLHALRNALIAPFTVIMLQFPWLLNGVVIVETLFNYKGFGWMLVTAAGNNDISNNSICCARRRITSLNRSSRITQIKDNNAITIR